MQQGSTVGVSKVRRRTRHRSAQPIAKRLRTMVAAGAVLAALASGCAEPAPPQIAIRDAPASPAKLTLPKPAKGGLVPGPKWPKACDLVSPADIEAILPDATGIEHRGLDAEFEIVEGRNLARLRKIKVPQRSCQIEFDLPHPDQEASSALRSATIQVQLDAVGSPKIAQMNYNALGDLVEGSDADECRTLADTNYNCLAGGVVFTVDGSAAPDLVFRGQQGEATTFYGHRVLQEFVKLIAAKVSTVPS